jgi:small redox-active disulfide protein 2
MKRIEVLGVSCAKCNDLEAKTKQAIKETGVEAEVVHIADIKKIAAYKVLFTPALVVDGVVKVAGKIPKLEEIKEWIR